MSQLDNSKAHLTYLIVLAQLVLVSFVSAAEDVDQSQAVNPIGTIKIGNPRGDLEIHGWDRPEVRVVGELDDLAKRLLFDVEDDVTVVRVDMPRRNVNWGDGSDLEIYVPRGAKLQVGSVSSDIKVDGVVGPIAIRTVSGNVDVRDIGSNTRIKTVSGDIEVAEGVGKLWVMTTSGDMDVEVKAEEVFVDTMNGTVDMQLGRFDSLTASSVNGALQLAGQLNPAAQLTAKTINADMEVAIAEPLNAHIRAMTAGGGEIENDLSDDEPKRNRSGRLVLDMRLGDGSSTVSLNTVNGTIEIE